MTEARGPRRTRCYLVGDRTNPRIRRAIEELRPWLEERVRITGTSDLKDGPLRPGRADFVLILGGDGAILQTGVRLAGRSIPCIGIRLGHFGFLAELEPTTCRNDLERIFAGEGTVNERFLLDCEVRRSGKRLARGLALNDAVVLAHTPSQMLALALDVDGEPVTTVRGDGLILATPIGSTAHSLAAGGPVVEPSSRSILVTPLAPHTLSSRPLVLDARRRLTVHVLPRYRRTVKLVLDGQRAVPLKPRDRVEVRRSNKTVRFLSIVDRSFFRTLREKFRWGGSTTEDGESRAS
ncbi:MAG: NAD(+)/NADH kinase [Planctomycetota bacterium JB042]